VRIVYGELPNPFARGLSGLRKFVEIYTNLKIKLDDGESGVKILESLVHSIGFEDYLRSSYPEDFDERWLNVIELQNALSEFLENHVSEENHPLADFLEMAALITEPTSKNVQEGSTDAVTLMTIHASKGLEFKSVYVSGLEEGALPHANCLDSQGEIEEERRLLYVAMTRAKENLTLTRVRRHRCRRDLPTEESRFLAEIPEEFVTRMGRPEQRKLAFGIPSMQSGPLVQSADDFFATRTGDTQRSNFNFGESAGAATNLQNCPFRIGSRIRHKIFGEGIVKGIEPSVGVFRLEIRFAHVGTKKLIHTYVSLAEDESGSSDDDGPESLQRLRITFEENSAP
jgi:DNA helicase-2/ATP-dependent DNA helicase PcrA